LLLICGEIDLSVGFMVAGYRRALEERQRAGGDIPA